jgi:cation transport regulator ChaC
MAVGILAYGSLLDDLGEELSALIVRRTDGLRTPFSVEYARSSRTRDGAPTLVPVLNGGSSLVAALFELDPHIDVVSARTLLFRRESHCADAQATSDHPSWIRQLHGLAGIETSLYVALDANLRVPTPRQLAQMAGRSAARGSGARRQDGISYLDAQLRRGVTTPLTEPYVEAILALTGADDLGKAWQVVREAPDRFDAEVEGEA